MQIPRRDVCDGMGTRESVWRPRAVLRSSSRGWNLSNDPTICVVNRRGRQISFPICLQQVNPLIGLENRDLIGALQREFSPVPSGRWQSAPLGIRWRRVCHPTAWDLGLTLVRAHLDESMVWE